MIAVWVDIYIAMGFVHESETSISKAMTKTTGPFLVIFFSFISSFDRGGLPAASLVGCIKLRENMRNKNPP
jgi:hypothetical protein